MQTRRQLMKTAAGLGAGLAGLGGMATQARAATSLTYSVWLPPTHALVRDFAVPWSQKVEEATGGEVKVTIPPKPVTNPAGHLNAARTGIVDIVFVSQSYYPGMFELEKVFILPFGDPSARITSIASYRIYQKYMAALKRKEYEGLELLGTYTHGPGAVFTNGKVVQDIKDFEGLRIRIGGGMAADVGRLLKVNAVVKPAPESYELLSTGVVDGVFFPPEAVATFKLDTAIKEATVFPGGLYGDMHSVVMNKKAYDGLTEAQQQAIRGLSGEVLADMAGNAWGSADTAAMKSLEDHGVQIREASPELVTDIREAVGGLELAWRQEAAQYDLDADAILADYREELKKVQNELDAA